MKRYHMHSIVILGLLLVMLILATCSDDTDAISSINHPPGMPAAISPCTTDVCCTPTLIWTCTDPDNDPLTYDVHFDTAITLVVDTIGDYFDTSVVLTVISTNQSDTSYCPGTLEYDTKYYWRIVARDNDGVALMSDTITFCTRQLISIPDCPIGLDSGCTNQIICFTTGNSTCDSGHAIEYRFYRGNGEFSDWGLSNSACFSWAEPGLYKVVAQARCHTYNQHLSGWSIPLNVEIALDDIAPTVPLNLQCNPVSQTQLDLVWNAASDNAGVGGYNVYRDDVYLATVTDTTFSDDGLACETQYCYRVSAIDAAENESALSGEECGTTEPCVIF